LGKARFLIKPLASKHLSVILASVLLLAVPIVSGPQVAWSQAEGTDKEKVVRQVAQYWIQVGAEQYKRGFFKASEQSFIQAQEYQEYLTVAEREKLKALLEKTRVAAVERGRILGMIQTADELVERGQLIRARAHFEKVQGNEFLTKEQRKLIAKKLEKVDNRLEEQREEIAKLYSRSVKLYHAGQLEAAREGFIQVARSGLLTGPAGKTAEDYLLEIDSILMQRVEPSLSTEIEPGEKPSETGGAAIWDSGADKSALGTLEPDKSGRIEVTNRRSSILRSYTRAVVSDAIAKAQDYLSQGEFDKAKETVVKAEQAVNKNRLHLGEELFRQYSSELKQLTEKIVKERTRWLGSWENKDAWRL